MDTGIKTRTIEDGFDGRQWDQYDDMITLYIP